MTSRLNPYLAFPNNSREAMEFYRSVFGGNLNISNFGDMARDPADRDKVMHAILETPKDFVLMASDTGSGMSVTPGNNFSISLSGDDEAELRGYWDKLSEGANIVMQLEKAPWGDTFGMLTDRYGIGWMVNIAGASAQ